MPHGDYRELKRLVFGLLVVVCSSRVFHLVIDAVDLLGVDRSQRTCPPPPMPLAVRVFSAAWRNCCGGAMWTLSVLGGPLYVWV